MLYGQSFMGTKSLPRILQHDLRWLSPLDSCPCPRGLAEELHFLIHTMLSAVTQGPPTQFMPCPTPSHPGPWPLLIPQPSTVASKPALLLPSYLVGFPQFVSWGQRGGLGDLQGWCCGAFSESTWNKTWGHSMHRLAKSYPSYSKQNEEKRLKVATFSGEMIYPEDFYQQGEETWVSRKIRYPGNLGSFWKSEDKGSWVGTPVNRRWEEMKCSQVSLPKKESNWQQTENVWNTKLNKKIIIQSHRFPQ